MLYFGRRYFNGPTLSTKRSLTNQVIIITGSSAGIGKAAAVDLLESGATVVYACRNEKKTKAVFDELPDNAKARAHFIELNLSSLTSVRRFVDEFDALFDRLDVLINNAGTYPDNEPTSLTEDGIEVTWQSNYFGHYLLTTLLLDKNKFNQSEGRIINVSSWGHRQARTERIKALYESLDRGRNRFEIEINDAVDESTKLLLYADTKLANVLFTQHLKRNVLHGDYSHILAYSLHPGVVLTEIWRGMMEKGSCVVRSLIYLTYPFIWYFTKDIQGGAQTTLYLVHEEKENLKNGEFYQNNAFIEMSPNGRNDELAMGLMRFSKEITLSPI